MTNDNKSTDTHVDTHIDRDVYRVNKGSWIVSWSWYDENNNINVNYLVWLHWKKIMGRPTLSEPQKWRRIRRRTETRKVIRRFCLNSMEIGSNWEEMERLLAREEGYKLPAVCYSIRFFRSPPPQFSARIKLGFHFMKTIQQSFRIALSSITVSSISNYSE